MSTPSRRKNIALVEQLIATPQNYSFFQAVRLLERAALFSEHVNMLDIRRTRGKNFIAGFAPPTSETLRIKSLPSMRFPNADIHSVIRSEGDELSSPWIMTINFLGLAGAMGVLPYHYTEMILQRVKQKDESLLHFLDLFVHRTASLFYQASTKYHLPLEYERKKLIPDTKKLTDKHTQALLSIIGIGTSGLYGRLNVADESLLFYSGLFSQHVRTTSSLVQILQDYFQVPIKIHEFIGQWQELLPDMRTQLASKMVPFGQNAQLGRSAILGKKGWFAQGKIRISLGPLNQKQFYQFAPSTKALNALNDMVRLYLGLENDYDFIIEVKRKDIPRQIQLTKNSKPIMGWNTWLSSGEKSGSNRSDTLKIVVSANRLNSH